MKTLLHWLNFRPIRLALLGVASITALISLGFVCDFNKSDWGTWVGSIGTVATLLGTIWIATDSARQRHRDETDLAIITAAEFSFRIHAMQETLQNVISKLPGARNGNYGDVFEECYEQIQAANIWNAADLKPLVIIPGHLAASLAFEATRIRAIASYLVAVKNAELLHIADVLDVERILVLKLEIAIQELIEPDRLCTQFLTRHGFHNTPLV
jgi:hypothetical protein